MTKRDQEQTAPDAECEKHPTSRDDLKRRFGPGAVPRATDFSALIDSMAHVSEVEALEAREELTVGPRDRQWRLAVEKEGALRFTGADGGSQDADDQSERRTVRMPRLELEERLGAEVKNQPKGSGAVADNNWHEIVDLGDSPRVVEVVASTEGIPTAFRRLWLATRGLFGKTQPIEQRSAAWAIVVSTGREANVGRVDCIANPRRARGWPFLLWPLAVLLILGAFVLKPMLLFSFTTIDKGELLRNGLTPSGIQQDLHDIDVGLLQFIERWLTAPLFFEVCDWQLEPDTIPDAGDADQRLEKLASETIENNWECAARAIPIEGNEDAGQKLEVNQWLVMAVKTVQGKGSGAGEPPPPVVEVKESKVVTYIGDDKPQPGLREDGYPEQRLAAMLKHDEGTASDRVNAVFAVLGISRDYRFVGFRTNSVWALSLLLLAVIALVLLWRVSSPAVHALQFRIEKADTKGPHGTRLALQVRCGILTVPPGREKAGDWAPIHCRVTRVG
ncbi:hypothetical protein [Thiocapsa marina]|uniref:Uncharacterized protein n=1 Tax=Thiocapsa marina 5811 TaxID=768671 RepID=F9U9K5_9GAMM|nr:hypothetical protein [Thiocapsa marina]EGV18803.1 hypothetical protein ThimaDRAFT_1607 [Thiocapsa marina 5811]